MLTLYFSSWGLKKSIGFAEELLPVHRKSNIKLSTLVAWVLPLFLELNRCRVYTQYLTSSVYIIYYDKTRFT